SLPPLYLHPFPTRRSSDLGVVSRQRQANIAIKQVEQEPDVARATFDVLFRVKDIRDPITRSRTRHQLHQSTRALWRDRARLKTRSEEHTSELQSRFDLVCR